MKKSIWDISMLEDLELRKKGKIVVMAITPIISFIVMIVFIIKEPQFWWVGLLLFLFFGVLTIPLSLLNIKFINLRIKELKELEELKNAQSSMDKKEEVKQNTQSDDYE